MSRKNLTTLLQSSKDYVRLGASKNALVIMSCLALDSMTNVERLDCPNACCWSVNMKNILSILVH